jgi:hypothetical protein
MSMPCAIRGGSAVATMLPDEAVAREEPLPRERAHGVGIVGAALRVRPRAPHLPLEALDESLTPPAVRLVLGIEHTALPFPLGEPVQLRPGPLEPPLEAAQHLGQRGGHAIDSGREGFGANRGKILLGPGPGERPLHRGEDVTPVRPDQRSQLGDVQDFGADLAPLREEVRPQQRREAAREPFLDLLAGHLVASPRDAVQRGQDARVHVLPDHQLVLEVEPGRLDRSAEEL